MITFLRTDSPKTISKTTYYYANGGFSGSLFMPLAYFKFLNYLNYLIYVHWCWTVAIRIADILVLLQWKMYTKMLTHKAS